MLNLSSRLESTITTADKLRNGNGNMIVALQLVSVGIILDVH